MKFILIFIVFIEFVFCIERFHVDITDINVNETVTIDGEEYNLVGGDILVGKNEINSTLRTISIKANKWKNGIIPYYIEPSAGYTSAQLKIIRDSMDKIEAQTNGCLKFIGRTNEKSYVIIRGTTSGCYSFVGQAWIGSPQILSLSKQGCVYTKIVIHELLHAAGFLHEHSRPDRDYYINIIWNNIRNGAERQFSLINPSVSNTFNEKYDFYSIMHYGLRAFSKNGQQTMVPRISSIDKSKIGNMKQMSDSDIKKLKLYYACQAK